MKKSQEKLDALAEGYKDTIDILRKNIKKNQEKLRSTMLRKDKTEIEIKLSLLRSILRENIEIYNFLTSYYNFRPTKKTHINEKGLLEYSVSDIVKAYKQGNFRLCDKLS